ncbi:MAG: Hsp70 family protein [Candidatus Aenigmarchaeota archaeon]|nr:Hsp70 family protein [Candidatus Aenigmarchaeota archaeon]
MTSMIGVDLGTTYCKLARLAATGRPEDIANDLGFSSTPTAVLFTGAGEVIFGQEAFNAAILEPKGFVAGWKREIGNPQWRFRAPDGKEHSAGDLMTLALSRLLAYAEQRIGERVTHVVLSIPANYRDEQRREMLAAGRAAGVTVISLIHEPTAAALAYAMEKKPGRKVLIYDLGGGTFDATLLQVEADRVEVLATEGIARCGGNDLLAALEGHCLDLFEREHGYRPTPEQHPAFCQDLRLACERGKLALSSRQETTISAGLNGKALIAKVSRDAFESLARPIIAPTIATCASVLKAGGARWADVDVVLVGGASRTPLVKAIIQQASGKPPLADVDPDHAVARGNAIEAALRLKELGEATTADGVEVLPPSVAKIDVCAHDLGCFAINQRTGRLQCAVIIPRNTPIPTERSDVFGLLEPGQTIANVVVVQGEEGAVPEACHVIGEVTLPLQPNGPAERRVKVAYRYDPDGIVHVVAEDTHSKKQATIDLATNGAGSAAS